MLRRLKPALIALCLTACGSGIYAQSKLDDLRNVIPPSPEASSLGKYGEWPVSLYTGIPSISIPIYELKGRGLSVPITISYNAAGNKVGEISSSVGLGWSLQTGGIISRSVRGIPDEDISAGAFLKRQLYTNQNDMCSMPLNTADGNLHKVQSAKGEADSEQDLYSFSAMGKSFKFFFKADGTLVPMPYSKIKLTTNFVNSGAIQPELVTWTALFEDGTKLEFGTTGFFETTDNARYNTGSTSFTTSWLLKKITTVNGEVFSFTYHSSNVDQDSYFSESEALKYNLGPLNSSAANCLLYDESTKKKKTERQQVTMLQVATIENDMARVEFDRAATEREDLKGGKALIAVQVYSKTENRYLMKYQFNQGYSQCGASNEYWGGTLTADQSYYKKRLKLLNLEKYSGDNQLENRWVFDYNPQSLPSRRSYAQDHWGFYNGVTGNTSLLPGFNYPLPSSVLQNYPNAGFNPPYFNIGANREGSGSFAQAEILQSITYPTGGKTTFTYEANSVPVNEEQFAPATTPNLQLNLNENSNPFTTLQEHTFTTTVPQNIQIIINASISSGIYNDRPSTKVTATIIRVATGGTIGGIATPGGATSYNNSERFNLTEPGSYMLRLSTNADPGSFGTNDAITASTQVSYTQSLGIQAVLKNTGGLRVKKMVTNDAINPANNIEKSYVYENPLIISPIDIKKMYFTETEETTCRILVEATPTTMPVYLACLNRIVTRNSSTKFSLGNVQGGTVGYGKVTTLHGASGSNGKTVSEFNNEDDAGLDMTIIYPYVPADSREHRRGLLLKQTEYNAANVAVSKQENTYAFQPKAVLNNFKAGYYTNYSTNAGCPSATCPGIDDCGIQKVCYGSTSEQVKQVSSTQTIYGSDGNGTLTTTTNNFYDNPENLAPTRTETVNSTGETIKTISRTPLEKTDINIATPLTAAASAAIDAMLNRNMIAVPLQTEVHKNGNLVNRSLINYKEWTPQILQPETVQLQQGTGPLETRLRINAYDNTGNLLEQQKEGDVKQCYLWDYSKTYPVAQVVNALQTDIAFTSFETAEPGSWTYAGAAQTMAAAPTGKKIYTLGNGNITRVTDAAKIYVVSVWASTASVTVNGAAPSKTGLTINGYTYYEWQVSSTSLVTVSGSAGIDELRLYPKDAQMTTYTYEPLVGLTSQCDINNNVTYYEYDTFSRLKTIRDKERNIIKVIDYKYQQ
jgi:hypothetical protein